MTSPALFVDHAAGSEIAKVIDRARSLVRRAKRCTTKAESRAGQDAHRSLHDAEHEIDRALRLLGSRV